MTQAAPSVPSIISVGNEHLHGPILNNWREYKHVSQFRALKKQFRNEKPALIVLCINDENDEQMGRDVTQYVREGLANKDTRIVLLHSPAMKLDEISWMEDMQINGCLSADESKRSLNLSTLNREIDTFLYIENNQRLHDAETNMLMCITRFSRDNESLPELLNVFSKTLATLCYSTCSFHIHIEKNHKGNIDYCDQDKPLLIDTLNKAIGLPEIPAYLKYSIDEKHPQINLLPEEVDLKIVEDLIEEKAGSYLTFPITAYGKVLYLLVYLIPASQMDKVSMKQINVINRASEQLTMLLERRQAESSLKKQYQRLKNALIELKSTKTELQHKEKMATIGQMAAGIAHEINNPLSYVISNFSSMDNYLSSIMQLQQLQSDFLQSIDTGQDQKIASLKQHISQFEQEEDMDFILEDIRAVVSDSFNGLQRVKNIITDLKSFTYSQSTQLENCDIKAVIDDTLKLLKYDIDDSITIEKQLVEIPTFLAHNGLMQQVLSNLVKNAAQALTEAKTPNPTITLSTETQGDRIAVRVRDNGPGIPEDKRNKIFEPFYTTKTVGEGTGLGLSVTFNIVKKLGGNISVESEPKKFTEFLITFNTKPA